MGEILSQYRPIKIAVAALLVAIMAAVGLFTFTKPSRIEITLQKLDGSSFSLDEISPKAKAVVVFIQGNGCPIVRKSIRIFEDLRLKYSSEEVAFYLINANPQDDANAIAGELKEYDIKADILKDSKQEFMKKMGVTRTAHLLILDRHNWKAHYSGALDQSLQYEGSNGGSNTSMAAQTLEQVIRGKTGEPVITNVKGCLIGHI